MVRPHNRYAFAVCRAIGGPCTWMFSYNIELEVPRGLLPIMNFFNILLMSNRKSVIILSVYSEFRSLLPLIIS